MAEEFDGEGRGRSRVRLDYPKFNEQISSDHYTFRIAAETAGPVEVSIDGGDWLPCRPAVGFWWFDWAGGLPGGHEVVARVPVEEGGFDQTIPRRFRVADLELQVEAGRKHGGAARRARVRNAGGRRESKSGPAAV